MSTTICAQCRMALRRRLRTALLSRSGARSARYFSSTSTSPTPREILSKPTWSVRSLLPSSNSETTTSSNNNSDNAEITPATLRHLLRLSALPAPSSPAEEAAMLQTLRSQLHFVRAIQQVDTTGVEPLRAIRDETAEGLQEQTIGLDTLRGVLEKEEVVGHARRPRRRRDEKVDAREVEDWNVLGGASETAGRYFVVRSGNGQANSSPESSHGDVPKD